MDNNEIFQEFWRSYQWPETRPVLFRLYHDDAGQPLEYSQEDREGIYIDITPEQYVRADFRVKVVDGKIVPQDPPPPPRLCRGNEGTRCHLQDVTVVTNQEPNQAWSMKQDEN